MTSSNERQISICLRKYNLEEIENEFLSQYLNALPSIKEEDRQLSLEILNLLRESRSVCTELQRLNYESGRITAKRIAKLRKTNALTKTAKEINDQCSELEQLIEQEKVTLDQHLDEYEAKTSETADRSRQCANFYDEEMMKGEIEEVKKILSDELAKEKIGQDEIAELKETLDNMNQDVPNNMSAIVKSAKISERSDRGGTELQVKLNSLNKKYSDLKTK